MLSQACVKNSVHRGGREWQGDVHGRGGGGACVAGETATAADGMHAAGMHSCLKGILVH